MSIASYRETRQQLLDEFESYFSTYPLDVSQLMEKMDRWDEKLGSASRFTHKALLYRAAEICPVKVFRTSPFFFELKSGRIRNSSKSGYPPGPGLEGWFMKKHMDLVEDYHNWRAPYKQQGIIYSEVFTDCAHHGVGYERVLKLGFSGILEQINERRKTVEDPERLALLDAMEKGILSMKMVASNFADEAERLLKEETEPVFAGNLKAVSEAARHVPFYPARTLHEALCTILFLREVMMSLEGPAIAILGGRLDVLLQPYLEDDLKNGRLTEEEAQNLIDHFITITDARFDLGDEFATTNNSLTIGGVDESGKPVWNDISRMILTSYEEYRFVNPKVQLRLSEEHPKEAFDQAARLVTKGINVLSILNDRVIVGSIARMGKKIEDARRYVCGGCQEPMIDIEFNDRAFAYINLPQVLNSVIDPELTDFYAKETPDFEPTYHFDSFEQLYEEFVKRLHCVFLGLVKKINEMEEHLSEFWPCPLMSCTYESCVEKVLDFTEGGCIYNSSSIPLAGMGTLISSLLAIREAVFDKKYVTLDELMKAIRADFKGYEILRGYLMNRCPKFGMDTEDVNSLSTRVFRDAAKATSNVPNVRGGLYEPSLFVYMLYDWMKSQTWATADGRGAGTFLSRGINPSDSSGYSNIANLLHTLSSIDLEDYPGCGVSYLEMPVSGDGINEETMSAVIKAFLKAGGSALDISMMDPEQLIEAKKNPEKYSKLIVRVCGFSAYFTSLWPEIQDEIIKRAFIYG